MFFLKNKQDCCGCSACLNICPNKCIKMKADNEGFLYPYIKEKENCTNCKACEKVCPIVKDDVREIIPEVYACKNKNEIEREESSSGGVFTLLAKQILKKNGVVYGALFDERFNVYHNKIDNEDELYKLRGSKYTQSNIGDCYKTVKNDLINDKKVLFSGTSCQIAGLKSFLKKDYENLYTVDVVCHGVPSPKVYSLYIDYIEKKYNSKIKKFTFRSKEEGWKNYKLKFEFENGEVFSEYGYENLYMKGFTRDLYIRPACTKCRFKKFMSGSDITLGDYWGVEKIFKDFDDNKGISLLCVNTVKGNEIFSEIVEKIELKKSTMEQAIVDNKCIMESVKKHSKSAKFYKNIEKQDFNELVSNCTKVRKETKVEYYFRALKNVIKIKLGYRVE